MKLFMTPGACSTGIHILLEELELVFEAHIVNLLAGDQYQPEYLAINPKASIPTLQTDDGSALTEFSAIAWWLARCYPKARLLPPDADGEAKVIEILSYVTATVHGQGFARIFTADKFAANRDDFEVVKAQGLAIVRQGFEVLNSQLPGEGYALGDFSIADAALFYVEFWADKSAIDLPENCLAHYRLMCSRPVVKRVLMEEGYRLE